jgi:hypothetical protein
MKTILSLILLAMVVTACATKPPKNQSNACAIFEQNRSWYKATRRVEKKWGVPISMQLAFVKKESSFDRTARPPRGKFLFVFPGAHISTAKGYAQALDGTWDEYRKDTGNRGANRKNFRDAVDFVGWYVNATHKRTGLSKQDPYGHYLAYHEGAGGYIRGSWKNKPEVQRRARQVADYAGTFEAQLSRCEKKFKRGIPLVPFV